MICIVFDSTQITHVAPYLSRFSDDHTFFNEIDKGALESTSL